MTDTDPAGYMQEFDEVEPVPEPILSTVDVRIVDTLTQRVAPQFASCTTFPIAQNGAAGPTGQQQVTQLLQRRLHRFKAKFQFTLGTATSLVFNSKPDPLTAVPPQGLILIAGQVMPDWESQQPLYATAIGGGNATVSVVDEAYGEQG